MKSNASKCDVSGCSSKVQAVCFTCLKLLCFNHSISHAQENAKQQHNIQELQDGVRVVQKEANRHLSRVRELKIQGERQNNIDREQYNSKLHPERFQQQLDEISFMKKETLKVVQKFFSEISLELVNMWQHYLKKYSSLDQSIQQLNDLEKAIRKYTTFKDNTYDQFIREYITENFEKEIRFLRQKFDAKTNQLKSIPQCPSIRIDDRILVELSQVLCNSISTINYTRAAETGKKTLSITSNTYLQKQVKQIPVFPIKKNHCYLFDVKNKSYEIQEFNNLDHLPDYPKTIIIPNGDIHIIGGVKKKDLILNSHLVFRSTSSEVFKLSELPYAVNPCNSLVYHNKYIYLIGGMIDKSQWTRRCIRYSLQSKQWSELSSLHSIKPHQSTCVFEKSPNETYIFCFGIPENKKMNIEKYNIANNKWEDIVINNFLSNPFNFASGFSTLQINETDIIFFGGKKFLENISNNKRSTDRELTPNVYLFREESNSFVQLGRLHPCLGVQYGQFTPIIFGGCIYVAEYLLSKNNPIARWYSNLHILQVTNEGIMESIALLNEE